MGGLFIIGFIFVWVLPLLKESVENQIYRMECLNRGEETYWSNDGLRYTSTDRKVYK